MKWHKFKDIHPEPNTEILYYTPDTYRISVEYVNEDGMILRQPNDQRIQPSIEGYWTKLPDFHSGNLGSCCTCGSHIEFRPKDTDWGN